MNFQVAREPLLRALQLLQNIVEPRQTLPILANVLIEARESGLCLAATDLEVGARVAVPGTVAQPGAITLAARKLVELVRELPDVDSVSEWLASFYVFPEGTSADKAAAECAHFIIEGKPGDLDPVFPDDESQGG